MKISDVAVARPVLTLVFTIAFLLMGIFGYLDMGINLLPDVSFPSITISSSLSGADPEVMELTVTKIIENHVGTISGVNSISSVSSFGSSSVTVKFDLSKNINQAMQQVRDRVSMAQSDLPSGMDPPSVSQFSIANIPIMYLAVRSDGDYWQLANWVKNTAVSQLEKIPGVGSIQTLALRDRSYRIWVDPLALAARGLEPQDIVNALHAEHVDMPAGQAVGPKRDVSIRVYGEFETAEALGSLTLKGGEKTVRLRDVARVEAGLEDEHSFNTYNRKGSIGLGIEKQSDANSVAVADAINAYIPELLKHAPEGIDIKVAYSQSKFITDSIVGVQSDIIFGGILTVLVMFLFLRSSRATIVTSFALPASLISTFGLMTFAGFTMNNFTMLALSLSVGMVIDDAIVVVENVYRHLEAGKKPMDAAKSAMDEIGFAVIVSTVSVIAVFLPIAFMKGIIGKFFYQFGLTVSFTLCLSLLVALTLTPMLASRFIKKETGAMMVGKRFWILNLIVTCLLAGFIYKMAGDWKSAAFIVFAMILFGLLRSHFDRMFKASEKKYVSILNWCMRHKIITLVLAGVSFFVSLGLAASPLITKELARPSDQGQFMINFNTPQGSSITETKRLSKLIEDKLFSHKEIHGAFLFGGTDAPNVGFSFVDMVPIDKRSDMSEGDMIKIMRTELNSIAGVTAYVSRIATLPTSGGGNSDLSYHIEGPDVWTLAKYAEEICDKLRKAGGYVDVHSNLDLDKPMVKITIDRDKADVLGVSARSLTSAIGMMMGGKTAAYMNTTEGRFKITIKSEDSFNRSARNIPRIMVKSSNGEMIELGDLVQVTDAVGPAEIHRNNRVTSCNIQANLDGKTQGQGLKEIKKIVEETLPQDGEYKALASGSSKQMEQTAKNLGISLLLAIIVVYLVLAAQFESFVSPFIIMTALPLAMTGVFFSLALTRYSIDMYSSIGIVMLVGIATKNGILLVDYTNSLRAEGMELNEALLKAGPVRMRPVCMTAIAAMAGMIPVALAFSAGGQTRASMGVAVFGGLFSSTPLTLIIIPVVYSLVDQIETWFKKHSMFALKLAGMSLLFGMVTGAAVHFESHNALKTAAFGIGSILLVFVVGSLLSIWKQKRERS